MENKYTVPPFWTKYASSNKHKTPEPWLETYIIDKLPFNITTIIDFGCGNGRNFIPFIKKYRCIGFDIHPQIESVCGNFEYHTFSIKDFIHNIQNFDNIDWNNSLVMTHGTLMYLDNYFDQNLFINVLKNHGCKNFIFHEYTEDLISKNAKQGKIGFLYLDEKNSKMFSSPLGEKKNFRDIHVKLYAHICLEK